MKTYVFEIEDSFNRPLPEIFEFFSDAANLNIVTPPWLEFSILTPLPITIEKGATIEYQLKLYGFTVNWKTEITHWEPPYRFVDAQIKGPYKSWVHQHRFEETAAGTRMTDRVEYAVPGLFLAPFFHKLFVRRDVERIFAYRRIKFGEIFKPW